MKPQLFSRVLTRFGQGMLVLLSFWLALFLAWQSLSWLSFGYPLIYDALDIGATIQQYAPLNLYKSDFALTDRAQHLQLFADIVTAINHSGQGLAQMVYYDRSGQVIDTLLRPAEVLHLQDVANLLDHLRTFSYWVMLCLLGLIVWFKMRQQRLENIGATVLGVFASLIVIAVAVIAYDAQAIFYALHTLVFPEGHQWFFYYQESLMTTLMKAPDIFAAIALLLVSIAFGYFVFILWWIKQFLNRRWIRA